MSTSVSTFYFCILCTINIVIKTIFGVTILPNGDWFDDWNTSEWNMPDIWIGDGNAFNQCHGWFYRPIGSPGWINFTREFTQPYNSTITITYVFVWGCDVCTCVHIVCCNYVF